MKYAQINTVPNGSTGGIMMKLHRELLADGADSYVFWGRGRSAQDEREMRFATDADVHLDALLTRFDGKAGFHSKHATKRLIKRLDALDPDVVHLHNLHGYYVNIEMLFEWLAAHRCQVKWTLHDCWAFTGHCAHFTYVKCAQWQSHCAYLEPCCQLHTYPKTISKRSCAWNFEQKKRLFNLLPPDRLTIITPSQWLADLVKKSFLSKYPIEVRHNTIDTSVFKPTSSDFRERYGVGDRFMILGVASPWTERKGLGDFIRLAHELDNERYAVVLVGLSKKQIARLKKELVALPRAERAEELAEAYSAADVYVQPSCEETFGMTVLEAQSCGSQVIVSRGSACEEISNPDACTAIAPDMSSLAGTVLSLTGGGIVILLERTHSSHQLAAIYTSATVFFNPTGEDNYPTVNLEARACGTPVATYDTGGCRETIEEFIGGHLLKSRDINFAVKAIRVICEEGCTGNQEKGEVTPQLRRQK